MAVDFPKSGKPADIDWRTQLPSEYPDFMEKNPRRFTAFVCERALGQMWRRACAVEAEMSAHMRACATANQRERERHHERAEKERGGHEQEEEEEEEYCEGDPDMLAMIMSYEEVSN